MMMIDCLMIIIPRQGAGGGDAVDGPFASGDPSPEGSGPRVNRAGLAVRAILVLSL